MSKSVHSVKLQAYDSVDLDRLSYSNGDLVYDLTNSTIRLMDGTSQGGKKLATQLWTTSQLASYVTNSSLTTTLNSYVTTTSLTTALNGYATSASLTTALASTVTTDSLTTTLANYATTASDALKAPLASPTFTGTVTAATISATKILVGGTDIKALALAMGVALG